MWVAVIGSTGVLGREAVPLLLAAGHDVVGVARNEQRTAAVRATGAQPVVADIFDVGSLAAALRGCQAVLNLATRIPAAARMLLPGAWKANNRLRVEGSAKLAAAAVRADVQVIVQEGVALCYDDGGDELLTEDAPVRGRGPVTASVTAHDRVLGFATDERRAVCLRIGTLVDPLAAAALLGSARRGGPVIFGDPAGWTSLIRPADAAAGAVAALDAPTGVYNLAAPAVRKREYGAVVAQVAGVATVRHLPRWMAMGALEILTRSQRVDATALTTATGWAPRHRRITADWLAP